MAFCCWVSNGTICINYVSYCEISGETPKDIMNKKYELLAKYLADLSKIVFGAFVIKQFVEHKISIPELVIGILSAIVLFLVAYTIQPKE